MEISDTKKLKQRNRLRHLKQYQELSDEDFDSLFEKMQVTPQSAENFEKRIKEKLLEFEDDYDFSEMKINDKSTLRALIQAIISLEDFEQHLFLLRKDITESNLYAIEKLNKVMSELRNDISKLQSDLNITRKIRKSDQETSLIEYLENLKEKARKFYESRMSYIFCTNPDCNELLATIWTLYPKGKNTITLICNRVMDDGKPCGTVVKISTEELLEKRGTNKKDIPQSMV
jgi:hypothetical protein